MTLAPVWLQAGLWGLIAGSALLLGAAVGFFAHVPQRWIAAVMAFGGGVLISALAFDLMDAAYQRGGFDSTAIGFLGGAAVLAIFLSNIPEGLSSSAGLITVAGFLAAFVLSKLGA